LASHLWASAFQDYDNGMYRAAANQSANWSYPASIYAAAVAIALSCAVLFCGRASNGFGALTFITGVVELSWASNNVDEDTLNSDSFAGTVNAWQSFAIMSSVFSIFFGLYFSLIKRPVTVDDHAQQKPRRVGAIIAVIILWTMLGIVASLFNDAYINNTGRSRTFGTNPRIVDIVNDLPHNYLNQISPFGWEHSIWAGVIISAWGLETLIHGVGSGGMIALSVTYAANLVGWAAEHHNVGSITGAKELYSRTRAWEALCLVAGVVSFLIAFALLRHSDSEESAKAPEEHNSIEAADRDNFATKGQQP